MESTISQDNPVLIVGGGNCGLAIASGLKKAGVPYVLFERDTEADFLEKTRDWGMLLHWGEEYLRKVLPDDLAVRLREATVDPHYDWKAYDAFPHLDADTGETIRYVKMPTCTRVSRKRLRKFLSEHQKLNIKYDKRLRKIDASPSGKVTIDFEDGSNATGACVVGSDGSRSPVRDYLCGENAKLVDTGITMINHSASFDAAPAAFLRLHHPIVKLAHSDRGETSLLAILDGSDKEHPENWRYQLHFSWKGRPDVTEFTTPEERLQFFREKLSHFCEPWRTAGLSLYDDEIVPMDHGAQFIPFQWDNRDGRVTLAGDAAHAMLPHRGQGLNNALRDASAVVDELTAAYTGDKTLNAAIDAYEAEMIPRGAAEVELTFKLASKTTSARYEDEVTRMGLERPESKI